MSDPMPQRALVQLRPLEACFFGSEQTFGNGAGSNYFAKGNPLPQQSTLTGVLRHLLYETQHRRGKHSFNPETKGDNDFGDLIAISPLFLTRREGETSEYFLRQAIDRYDDKNSTLLEPALLNENEAALFSDFRPSWQGALDFDTYDGKKDNADAWVNAGGKEHRPDKIFLPLSRPGITKSRNGQSDQDKAFYKQVFYRIERGWSFSVLADFSAGVDLGALDGICLPVGAEKTVFHISVKPETKAFEDFFAADRFFYKQSHGGLPRLVLVSDAFIGPEIEALSVGGVTETVDFRHIITHENIQPANFGPLEQLRPGAVASDKKQAKSVKYTLMRRGSVLYFADADKAKAAGKLLETNQSCRQAGFNHYFLYV